MPNSESQAASAAFNLAAILYNQGDRTGASEALTRAGDLARAGQRDDLLPRIDELREGLEESP